MDVNAGEGSGGDAGILRTIDAHCHLDQLADPAAAVEKALAAGVARILAVSEDLASMRAVLDLKKQRPGVVLAGLGIHPQRTPTAARDAIEREMSFLADHLAEADALGEAGLDFKHAATPDDQRLQGEILDRQLEIAQGARKPINLHSRRAQRATMERAIRFHRETGLNALLHWFTASKKLIRICAAEGIFVSAGPSVVAHAPTRDVVRAIPLDLLLAETDSPVPFDGRPAEPAWAARVTRELAALFEIAPDAMAARLGANLARYLA